MKYIFNHGLSKIISSVQSSGNRKYIVSTAIAVGGFPPGFYLYYRELAPVTQRARIMLINKKDSIIQGAKGAKKFESEFKCTTDAKMDKVMSVLIEANPQLTETIPKEDWRVVVVQEPDLEAFAFPNGTVFIFEDLLKFATTDDQRAMLLGHEMAQIFMSHPAELASREYFKRNILYKSLDIISSILPLPDILVNKQYVYDQLFDVVLQAPQAKAVEKEADLVGLMFAAKACFNPRAGVTFYNKLAKHELKAVTDCMERAAPNDDSDEGELCATAKLPSWKEKLFKNADRAKYMDSLQSEAHVWRNYSGECGPLATHADPALKPKEATALAKEVDRLVEKIKRRNLPEDPRTMSFQESKSSTKKN